MKKLGLFLFFLGVLSIGAYFVIGEKFDSVTVTFNTNGGTNVSEQVLKNGELAKEPDAPAKENSDFIEWQLNGQKYDFSSPVTTNISLNAIWRDYTLYTVKATIDSNEYTAQVRGGQTVSIEDLAIPSKEGFRIVLYQENGDEYSINSPINSDLSLTGKYIEIKKYKVTFNSNGGSKVDSSTVTEGDLVSEPTTTRDGYDFSGWYLDKDKFDFSTAITKNITLVAKWTEKGKINVIFMADGKVHKTSPVKEGTKVSKPTPPTKKGHKFVEWQLNGVAFDFNTKIMEETTLEALFEEVKAYTVTFDSDGGSKVNSIEVEVGKKATKPSNPTRDGYVFVEWQLNGKKYGFDKEVTEDITLKAVWEKEIPKYTVTFDSNGGSSVPSQTVKEGEKVTVPTTTRNGYKFEEWLYKNSPFDFSTPIKEDITLTARWSKLESNEQQNPDIIDNNENNAGEDEEK